ncbi:hypothetical protein B0H13DRAFT_2356373 [Mycena leptocephala]|nr:hypothetical protein B0H13DRAFT_2356373 [Mycena leptocephala]
MLDTILLDAEICSRSELCLTRTPTLFTAPDNPSHLIRPPRSLLCDTSLSSPRVSSLPPSVLFLARRYCDTCSSSRLLPRPTLFNTLHLLPARLLPPAVGSLPLPRYCDVSSHSLTRLTLVLHPPSLRASPPSRRRVSSSGPRRLARLTLFNTSTFSPRVSSLPPSVLSTGGFATPVLCLTLVYDVAHILLTTHRRLPPTRHHALFEIARLPRPPPDLLRRWFCTTASFFVCRTPHSLIPSLLRDSCDPQSRPDSTRSLRPRQWAWTVSNSSSSVSTTSNCITPTPRSSASVYLLAFSSLSPWPRFRFFRLFRLVWLSVIVFCLVRWLYVLFFPRKFLPASCPANVLQAPTVVKSDTSALAVTRIVSSSLSRMSVGADPFLSVV